MDFKVSANCIESGGIKKEIQDAFQARPKAKRMLHPSDGKDDEISDVQRSLIIN